MGNLRGILVSAAMLASFALLAVPAGATPSTSETIVLKRNAELQTIGWNAYGPTFFDSGSWAGDFAAFSADPAPIFAGTIKTIETGSAGSLELDFQVLTSPSPTDGFGGNCQLAGGTGAYLNYRGTGTWTFSTDGVTRFYTCTLTVHVDP